MNINPPVPKHRTRVAMYLALLLGFLAPVAQVALRAAPPVAAAAVVLNARPAAAQDDAIAGASATSTSGSAVFFAVPGGTRIALQSTGCAFHYRACATSTCVALQTDAYVQQFVMFDVPLLSASKYIGVACDGTGTGLVSAFLNNIP